MLLRWFRRHSPPPEPGIPVATDAPPVEAFVVRPHRANRALSLASATRDYEWAIAGGRLSRLRAHDIATLSAAMGPEIWAWQRARRLTLQPPWRASPNVDERCERNRAVEQMTADIATWERALVEVDADMRRAVLYGSPMPPPLDVPAAVMRRIEERRAAALERAARRRSHGGAGGAPEPRPEEAVHHPPIPSRPS